MRFAKWLWVGLAVLTFGCESEELDACPGPDGLDPSLVQSTFLLPDEATPNNNDSIGPFCCTGVTATIESIDGHPVGYAYFFGWTGQAYNGAEGHSYAPGVQILIAGLEDVHDPHSALVESVIELDASEMDRCAERSVKAGQLRFTATILSVTMKPNNPAYFDMQSLEARLDVSVEP
ncbi:hypothetical protein [Polyangium jinanense]|uniref:Lipoprotein n=1 Tax=Polyangium jinanense TaxID=2829994 RepID=A0A9X3X8U2_9BACT|nr:hypothetical protein [Polyangium jinanense]MDC3962240.1 hypothetical protein [Polyangium jinanense]MDC3983606.1 hypothetical protein [Polyangium jinanense]